MHKQKTIFLVDDSAANLAMGDELLSKDYTVYTINSGERMFKLIKNITPDLILLDIEMPEMDGYEVLKKLKENIDTADIPVIFVTARNTLENELLGFSMGAVDYITKPFSADLLLKRIEVHILMEAQKHELLHYSNNLKQMVDEKTEDIINLKNTFISTMAELVEQRDTVTGGHIERTQQYIKIMLDVMKDSGVYYREISKIDINLVMRSSQLHDIGKISIKDHILTKPSSLTNEEFDEIKKHPDFGASIIAKIQEQATDSDFLEYAKIFAKYHHEKWNGKGYPAGLAGEAIPLLGRVMAIADVYDALVTERPYKKAFSHAEAIEIIRKDSGTHFDPILVDLFLSVNHKFESISQA